MQMTLTRGFGGAQFSLLHTEVIVCLNKHQTAFTLKRGSQLFLGFLWICDLFSLGISFLPTTNAC